jgi:hypothetical protein
LQLENQELMNWKQQLQTKINNERAELVNYKKLLDAQTTVNSNEEDNLISEADREKLIKHYFKENQLLEQKMHLLANQLRDENLSLIKMQVECSLQEFVH